jgi:hypothetical protein
LASSHNPRSVIARGVGFGALARARQGWIQDPDFVQPFGLIVGDARSFARCELATVARGASLSTQARAFPLRSLALGGGLATMARGEALTTCARGDTEDEGQANG